jgi:hypothetical protein
VDALLGGDHELETRRGVQSIHLHGHRSYSRRSV